MRMHDLEEIWMEHARDAFRVCRAFVGRDLADDALGRVSLAAQSSVSRGNAETIENPRAWLLTIARHVCIDIHRERRRCTEECLPEETLERVAAHRALSSDYGNPERQFLAREQMRRAESALQLLPPELSESLRALADGTSDYAALARTLGITAAALRKRIQRARSRLRRCLS